MVTAIMVIVPTIFFKINPLYFFTAIPIFYILVCVFLNEGAYILYCVHKGFGFFNADTNGDAIVVAFFITATELIASSLTYYIMKAFKIFTSHNKEEN